jgi:hypothetical protein
MDIKDDQTNLWLAELNDALYSAGTGSKVEVYRETLLKLARLVRRQRMDVIDAQEAVICAKEDHAVARRQAEETNQRYREVLRFYACECDSVCNDQIAGDGREHPCGYKAREALEGKL